ncbi:MAG TPA: M28 family peptidase [Polyangiaceae bacterium]|nr:M28 family peptidase [Polyangiaceae bacterium]
MTTMQGVGTRRWPLGVAALALSLYAMALERASADAESAAAPPIAPEGSAPELPQPPAGHPVQPQAPDAELTQLLSELDRTELEASVLSLVSFGTRHTLSTQTDPERGIGAATDWAYDELSRSAALSGGRMTVELQSFVQAPDTRVPEPTVLTNIVATLRGTSSPDRVYVVSAHIDSRVTDVLNAEGDQPAADDDASGVAVVLDLARVFALHPPEATLVFTIVPGEEQGLLGSGYQAAAYLAAGADIQAMFSNDIVGSSTADNGARDPHTLRLFTEGVPTAETAAQTTTRQSIGGENDGESRQLGRFVQSVADNAATDMRIWHILRRDRYLRGSDHISYLRQGYPAARFTEPNENFAHEHQDVREEAGTQFGDLPEFLDYDFMLRVAKVNAATLYSLAAAPGTPKNVRMLTQQLTNTTELAWDRGTEPDLAGYEVVWRASTDLDWTHAIPVGDVTGASFPNAPKDNFEFGVRALDSDGHHSPVAYPIPG